MIKCSSIYDNLLSLIRKDRRGWSFTPDDFNNIVPQVNQRIFRLALQRFEESKFAIVDLDSFKIVKYPVVLDVNAGGALPTNFYYPVGDPYYYYTSGDGKYVSAYRRIELVTSLEFRNREMDYLSKSTVLYPLVYMGYGATSDDMEMYVNPPTDMASKTVYIDYIRKVDVPFLDYYINNITLEITLMDAGDTLVIPIDCTARDGSVAGTNVVSLTTNFEWHEHDIPSIINQLLEAIGIQLGEQGLVQLAELGEPKLEKE